MWVFAILFQQSCCPLAKLFYKRSGFRRTTDYSQAADTGGHADKNLIKPKSLISASTRNPSLGVTQ